MTSSVTYIEKSRKFDFLTKKKKIKFSNHHHRIRREILHILKKKFHTKSRAFYIQKGEKSIFSLISYVLLLKVAKITTHFEEASGFFVKYAPRDAEIRF